MAKLKSSDILGELASEEITAAQHVESVMPAGQGASEEKPIADLEKRKKQAEKHGAGKPSPYQSDLREKLRQKEQFNFGLCPKFVVKEFERLRKSSKMNKREFLYHLLREAGADIPPYKEMDGRKL